MLSNKKYLLYATIKPYDLKISLVFSSDSRIRYIQEFIEDTMRNFKTKYKVGRIEHKKTSSILLPDYKIGEVLEDKDELIIYSIEYGLTKKTLSSKNSIEDIDNLFIGKKLKRDIKHISRKGSGDKKSTKKEENNENENNNNDNDNENENEEEEDEDDDNNEKSLKNEKNKDTKKDTKKENKKDIKNDKNIRTEENSSSSGEDNSQDLKIWE